jgi:pimeloyl-ACP methyl ester carboxylesterase/uncharacterized protein YndB with AHSA1/START domain
LEDEKMPSIQHELLVGAPATTVFDAITRADGLSAWWTDARARPEAGTVSRFIFGPDYFKEMRIDRLEGSSEVLCTCIAGDDEWVGTTIRFQLEEGDAGTLLKSHPELADQLEQQGPFDVATVLLLQHDGWRDRTPMFAECNYTWGRFLRGLKLLCETGTGRPWPQQHKVPEPKAKEVKMTMLSHTTRVLIALVCALALMTLVDRARADDFDEPPSGFSAAIAEVNGTKLHYVRGGGGPAVILVHGFPEDWTEYKVIMPRLAQRFDVIAVDLPGIGKSAPAAGGCDAMNLAAHIEALSQALDLKKPYIVGHDIGAIVTYAYVRSYADNLRGAMILDVPVPGIAGWDEAVDDLWHIGFIQVPDLPEALVTGRQEAFIGYNLSEGHFGVEQRAHYINAYGPDQLHAAFEIYRAFPKDGEWNETQTAQISVPLTVVVGEKSYFARFLTTFMEGYRAKGITNIEGATIPNAAHYMLADNPESVAELIERQAAAE